MSLNKTIINHLILALAFLAKAGSCYDYSYDYSSSNSTSEEIIHDGNWMILSDILTGQAPLSVSSKSYIDKRVAYSKNLRPTGIAGQNTNINAEGALLVTINLALNQFVSLDEKNQIWTTSFYL